MDPSTVTGADPLTDLLNGVRTTGAVFNRSWLSGTWAARFEDGSPLAVAIPLGGPVWIMPRDGEAVRLAPNDVAVLSGGTPYVMADDPASEPQVVIGPGGRCTTVDGEYAGIASVSAWGAPEPGSALLLNGLYTMKGGAPGRLLAALPPLAVVGAGEGACPFGASNFEDLASPGPGRQVMLDRMLDLMLLAALRAWFTRPGAPVPAWYRANSDPVTGQALELLHADPGYPWTVAALAAKTGVSRAALARRFTDLVGVPPMTYLREHRLDVAAELLREPGATIGAVAGRVGFSSAFALSAAFKKIRGISPSRHRAQAVSAPPRPLVQRRTP